MNIILMEIYDEYDKYKTINKLKDFTKLTFPNDGTDKVFIGCVLILITNVYKTRVNAESLYTVVHSAKESVGTSNLLKFYLDRVNSNKMISKYLSQSINDDKFMSHINLILEYIKRMSFNFSESINTHYQDKIKDYISKQQ